LGHIITSVPNAKWQTTFPALVPKLQVHIMCDVSVSSVHL